MDSSLRFTRLTLVHSQHLTLTLTHCSVWARYGSFETLFKNISKQHLDISKFKVAVFFLIIRRLK